MKVNIKFNDGSYIYPENPSKRKMSGLISRLQAQNVKLEGTCTVKYGKDYKNQFEFNGKDDLKFKLWPCIEKELVKDFSS